MLRRREQISSFSNDSNNGNVTKVSESKLIVPQEEEE